MEAKKYLLQHSQYENRIRRNNSIIRSRRRMISEAMESAASVQAIDYSKSRVQTSPKDAMLEKVANFIDKGNKVYAEIQELIEENQRLIAECQLIVRQIQDIGREEYADILMGRYVDRLSFQAIAHNMRYSYSRVTHMHGEALQVFEEKYIKVSNE